MPQTPRLPYLENNLRDLEIPQWGEVSVKKKKEEYYFLLINFILQNSFDLQKNLADISEFSHVHPLQFLLLFTSYISMVHLLYSIN